MVPTITFGSPFPPARVDERVFRVQIGDDEDVQKLVEALAATAFWATIHEIQIGYRWIVLYVPRDQAVWPRGARPWRAIAKDFGTKFASPSAFICALGGEWDTFPLSWR